MPPPSSFRAYSHHSSQSDFSRDRLQPSLFLLAGGGALSALSIFTEEESEDEEGTVNWDRVRKEISDMLETKEDENYNGPLFIRLAFNSSCTYDKNNNTGGPNGATMRFNPESDDSSNQGLQKAISMLETIKKKHPAASCADLWTLAGCVAIEEMGGPKIDWRSGRTDLTDETPDRQRAVPAQGLLPNSQMGADRLRNVFHRMGFDDREIVALSPALSLALRCHRDNLGYEGTWKRTPKMISVDFFRELVGNKWTQKKWKGPKQYVDESGDLIMLMTDIAILEDPEFSKYVHEYKDNEEQFLKDFAAAWKKLIELGVPAFIEGVK